MDFFNQKISNIEKEIEEEKKRQKYMNPNTTNQQNPQQNPQQNIPQKTEQKPSNENLNINFQKSSDSDNAGGNVLLTKSVVTDIEKFSSGNYIPKKINKSIQLPIDKNSKDYKKVKEEIMSNIEDGMCELEYFHMDYAMEHVETALYYLRNIKE